MRFTLSWLEEHIEWHGEPKQGRAAARPDAQAVAETLDKIGLEVKALEAPDAALEAFSLGRIVEATQHPNADRLRVCKVEVAKGGKPHLKGKGGKTEIVQVVCGAPNAKTGLMGVFAPPGTWIPGTDVHLKPAEIRGVESCGMLLSERELGISDEHEGIIALDDSLKVGTAYLEATGQDETTFTLGITPNRGDCFAVRGIARELAAAGYGVVRPLPPYNPPTTGKSPLAWHCTLSKSDLHLAPAVRGRYFSIEQNATSPEWLRRRLAVAGTKVISPLVDLTNYFTFDLGRPLHVFDADKLTGAMTIRRARKGESVLALDEVEYQLTPADIVIADGKNGERAVAIAGVMGGLETGVTAETKNVFLEAAFFDHESVAFSGRRHGIDSEARRRFERGIDPQSLIWGERLAAGMILRLCGGTASAVTGYGTPAKTRPAIALPDNAVHRVSGAKIPLRRQRQHLEALGFTVSENKKAKKLSCRPPTWRGDITRKECLVEEILRIEGYDCIKGTALPPSTSDNQKHLHATRQAVPETTRQAARVRALACLRGLDEHLGYSFVSEARARLFLQDGQTLTRVLNPISTDLSVMRPSLLASLIPAAARNLAQGAGRVAQFELGPTYKGGKAQDQELRFAVIRAGLAAPRSWREDERQADIFDTKGDALAVLAALGAPTDGLRTIALTPDSDSSSNSGSNFPVCPGWLHSGRAGALVLGKSVLALFGEIHPSHAKSLGLRSRAAVAEVYLEAVPPRRKNKSRVEAAPDNRLQPVVRDFAFVADKSLEAETLLRSIAGAAREEIVSVRLFDIYEGKELGADKSSFAVEVLFRPHGRAYTEADLEALSKTITDKVQKATGAVLR